MPLAYIVFLDGPSGPVDPGYGRPGWGPVDPGFGNRPPVDPGYGRPGWSPVDPGYGVGAGNRPSHPIYMPPVYPGGGPIVPPVYPSHGLPGAPVYPSQGLPVYPDQGLPPASPGVPTHPIYLPPGGGGATPSGGYVIVFVPGVGWTWAQVGGPPDTKPEAPVAPDQGLPPTAEPKA